MTSSDHDIDFYLHWCKRCGRPRDEIVEQDLRHCDGLKGVVHQKYLKAKQEAEKIFNPIVDAIWRDL